MNGETDTQRAAALYEQGNAYRKQQRWADALNAYAEAARIDPQSAAVHAYQMLSSIMNYRCKDYYNP